MKRSLQHRLSKMMITIIVITGLLAAAISFNLSYLDTGEFQDGTLRQIAALVTQNGGQTNYSDNGGGDPAFRLWVIHLDQPKRPAWLDATLASGFHTVKDDRATMRVFVRDQGQGKRVAVVQATAERDETAMDSVMRTLVPLLLLLPVLAWLSSAIIRSELAPVRQLAERLDRQAASQPEPLPDVKLPEEVAPFMHAINRLLGRVNRLVGQQRRFIADAAHELRSPLTALSLQAQNLEKADSLDAMHERVGLLRTGIERARHLTDQLLTLARSQAGNVSLQQVDLSRLVREMIAQCLPLAEARGIDLGLEELDKGLQLTAAPEMLSLILRNAIDNAVRYSPDHGEVTIRLSVDDHDALIDVIDNGPGIIKAERERVFDPFYRSESAGSKGSGLGLAIARDAAMRLGGVVSLEDRPDGNGLRFRYRQTLSS